MNIVAIINVVEDSEIVVPIEERLNVETLEIVLMKFYSD